MNERVPASSLRKPSHCKQYIQSTMFFRTNCEDVSHRPTHPQWWSTQNIITIESDDATTCTTDYSIILMPLVVPTFPYMALTPRDLDLLTSAILHMCLCLRYKKHGNVGQSLISRTAAQLLIVALLRQPSTAFDTASRNRTAIGRCSANDEAEVETGPLRA